MKRIFFFIYGTLCYLFFLGIFFYAVGFLGNFVVPTTIDGQPQGPIWEALTVNTLLLGLFALQHSVMARSSFKRWWTLLIPQPLERSTYVLFTNLALAVLFYAWQPMGGDIWHVQHPIGRAMLFGLFGTGWVVVLMATIMINHFDLFGMRQVWMYARQQAYTPLPFQTPALYRYVRHPLYVGWLLVFWCTPMMTSAHLMFALTTTIYILMAIRWEERDLVTFHGPVYEQYRNRVPMLIPRFSQKKNLTETPIATTLSA